MTRNDLITAKAILDNLDQLTSALATLSQQKGGSVMVNVGTLQFRFDAADLIEFLTAQRTKMSSTLLTTYDVTTG